MENEVVRMEAVLGRYLTPAEMERLQTLHARGLSYSEFWAQAFKMFNVAPEDVATRSLHYKVSLAGQEKEVVLGALFEDARLRIRRAGL